LELEAHDLFGIQAVQVESFAAEFRAIQENMPLPAASKVARFNTFLFEGSFGLVDDCILLSFPADNTTQ
jgi:hypothetical protein